MEIEEDVVGCRVYGEGVVLVHPYFWGTEPLECEVEQAEGAAKVHQLWRFTCPTTTGSDDPIINPGQDPNLGKLASGNGVFWWGIWL